MPNVWPNNHIVLLRQSDIGWRTIVNTSLIQLEYGDLVTFEDSDMQSGKMKRRVLIRHSDLSTESKKYVVEFSSELISLEIDEDQICIIKPPQRMRLFSDYSNDVFVKNIRKSLVSLNIDLSQFQTYALNLSRYQISTPDIRGILKIACKAAKAKAGSLWLFNRYTDTFTLADSYHVHTQHYESDWFHRSDDTVIGRAEKANVNFYRFDTDDIKSNNSAVSKNFSEGVACKLCSRAGSLIGYLIFYDVDKVVKIQLSEQLGIVAEIVNLHLLQLRGLRRKTGTELINYLIEQKATETLPVVMQKLCDSASDKLNFGACTVFLSSEGNSKTIALTSSSCEYYKANMDSLKSVAYNHGEGITGKVAKNNDLKCIYDLSSVEEDNTHGFDETIPSRDRKSWLGVPIISPSQDTPIGVLRAINKYATKDRDDRNLSHFTGSDVEALNTLARIAGHLWDEDQLRTNIQKSLNVVKKASMEKSNFIESLNHEILAPLHPLKNLIDLIEYKVVSEDEEGGLKFNLRDAGRQLDQIEMMVRNVSVLTNPVSAVQFEDISVVKDLVHTIVDLFRMRAEKDKDVDFYFTDRLWHLPRVRVDPQLVRQALFVLVNNAFKYCDDGSTITIDGARVRLGHEVEIYVIDQGIGVPVGWDKKIFQRTTRAPNAIDDRYPGSGLGLTIAEKLVEASNGRIYVSKRMNPTVFTMLLPVSGEYFYD